MNASAPTRKGGARRTESPRGGLPIWRIVLAVVALFAVVAVVATLWSGDEAGGEEATEVADVTIEGDPLPPYQGTAGDGAIGAPAPSLVGWSFNHTGVEVQPGERPMILVFMAHWCPYCQNELPVLTEWQQNGGAEGVDLVAIATATDETRPNYPPSAWFADEGFDGTVLVDDANSSAANAYGLTSLPFFVFVNGDGQVVGRTSGELSAEQLDAAVAELTTR